MRTIRISEEVWEEIAKRGKFGETPDNVLRRVFQINETSDQNVTFHTKTRIATQRMSARVENGYLLVEFHGGSSEKWSLPPKTDKITIGSVRKKAVRFAENNGATIGQVNAVVKAMTDAGYHLTK